jgi:hypothetical protein
MNSYVDPRGKRIEWQKATDQPDGITSRMYVSIAAIASNIWRSMGTRSEAQTKWTRLSAQLKRPETQYAVKVGDCQWCESRSWAGRSELSISDQF